MLGLAAAAGAKSGASAVRSRPGRGAGRGSARRVRLARAAIGRERCAERFEQLAIDRIALRLVLGMPLHAEREAGRLGDAYRLVGAVLGDALDDDALARIEDALAVQRVDTDALDAEQPRERAALRQSHL